MAENTAETLDIIKPRTSDPADQRATISWKDIIKPRGSGGTSDPAAFITRKAA